MNAGSNTAKPPWPGRRRQAGIQWNDGHRGFTLVHLRKQVLSGPGKRARPIRSNSKQSELQRQAVSSPDAIMPTRCVSDGTIRAYTLSTSALCHVRYVSKRRQP